MTSEKTIIFHIVCQLLTYKVLYDFATICVNGSIIHGEINFSKNNGIQSKTAFSLEREFTYDRISSFVMS